MPEGLARARPAPAPRSATAARVPVSSRAALPWRCASQPAPRRSRRPRSPPRHERGAGVRRLRLRDPPQLASRLRRRPAVRPSRGRSAPSLQSRWPRRRAGDHRSGRVLLGPARAWHLRHLDRAWIPAIADHTASRPHPAGQTRAGRLRDRHAPPVTGGRDASVVPPAREVGTDAAIAPAITDGGRGSQACPPWA